MFLAIAMLCTPFGNITGLAQTNSSSEEMTAEEYQEWKSSLASKRSDEDDSNPRLRATYSNLFGNQYIEAYVRSDGRFTMGTASGQKLLYGHPSPWSSFTTIRIDNSNYIFTADGQPQINAAGTEAVSTMTRSGTTITQRITIINNPSTNRNDIFRIRYEMRNTSSSSQNYGTRIMLDTQLGSNDGSPFVIPGIGAVTTEREFTGSSIPQSWQSVDSLTNPTVMSVGTMWLNTSERPDKLQFAHWGRIDDTLWDYTVSSSRSLTGDSAVGIYFNPQSCSAGQTRTVTTYYGLSGDTIATQPTKKAIYILPGYLGSELYDDNGSGEKLWVDALSNAGFWSGTKKDKFIQDSDGNPGVLGVDQSRDDFGANNEFKALVERLERDFAGEYDVIFWPYNRVADLNDSLTLLEENINGNKYTDIVFVTHSTGGLLASAYIAKSVENKRKVDKAILIAAPFFGTYASLFPIERGDSTKTGNPFTKSFWIDAATQNSWVRNWAHNSPTTYQLLPSDEYLTHLPIEDKGGWGDKKQSYSSINDFYKLLNQSDRINSKLTNGSSRSHQYFRNTTLRGNLVNQWSMASLMEVDVLLLGTASGHSTPSVAVYKEPLVGTHRKLDDIQYNKNGDGTVQGFSAKAQRKRDTRPVLPTDFSYTSNHGGLLKDTSVLNAVSAKISGTGGGGFRMAAASFDADVGMSEQIRIRYTSNKPVDAVIYDRTGAVVARANGYEHSGFDGDDFIYDSFSDDENSADALIYLPNQGYKVMFSHENTSGIPVDFRCEVSTLVDDGWNDISINHSANTTIANGVILTLDGTTQAILSGNIDSKITGDKVTHYTDWDLQDSIKLNLGNTQSVNVVGSQAAQVKSLLNWNTSDESIVEVSTSGVLTAKGHGTATISATDGNKSSVCEVTVRLNATEVELFDIDMVVGERTLINPQFAPSAATEVDMTYSVSANNIIEINEFGVIHALSAGTVTVTGQATYGVRDEFTVTVSHVDDYGAVAADKVALTWNTIKEALI